MKQINKYFKTKVKSKNLTSSSAKVQPANVNELLDYYRNYVKQVSVKNKKKVNLKGAQSKKELIN
jgi:hypothetical protein